MTETEHLAIAGHPVILYDGVCGLCNRIVQLLLRIDRTGTLLFVPLESPLAADLLAAFPAAPTEPEGVILLTGAPHPRRRHLPPLRRRQRDPPPHRPWLGGPRHGHPPALRAPSGSGPTASSPAPATASSANTAPAPSPHPPSAPASLASSSSPQGRPDKLNLFPAAEPPLPDDLPLSPESPAPPAAPARKKPSLSYADAGVDITAGDRAKQRIKMLARKTFNKNVLSEIGGFGGLFALDLARFPEPVLVSSADGVGTKLKVAFELGIHHTVGADLVNHCVNDIAVQGATPLFFLDYLATGRAGKQRR